MGSTDHCFELPTLLSKILLFYIFESGHFIVGVVIYMKTALVRRSLVLRIHLFQRFHRLPPVQFSAV